MLLARQGGASVPDVQCLSCATVIYLEEKTYKNYQGQVICSECKQQQAVVIQQGSLITASQIRDVYEPIRDILAYDVPQGILVDLAEAAIDLGAICFKSCVVMCRRVVQAALLEQGIADDKLSKMIEDAKNKQLFDESLYQTAKAIGFFGNSGAHPLDQELRKVESLEASLALQVTKRFLQAIYPQKPTVETANI